MNILVTFKFANGWQKEIPWPSSLLLENVRVPHIDLGMAEPITARDFMMAKDLVPDLRDASVGYTEFRWDHSAQKYTTHEALRPHQNRRTP